MQTLSSSTAAPQAPAAPPPWPIRLLRRAQPLVTAILRSPLHRLASHEILLLTWAGRSTGRTYTLPLSYVADGGAWYLCTRPDESRWWRNFRRPMAVTLHARGRDLRATAVVLESSTTEALDALRRFLTVNPRTGVMLYGVRRGPGGRPDETDLVREVRRSVVVRLTPDDAR